jgi:hypothetical protein
MTRLGVLRDQMTAMVETLPSQDCRPPLSVWQLVSSPMLTSAVLCASRCRFLTLSTRRTGNPLIWSGRLGPRPGRLAARRPIVVAGGSFPAMVTARYPRRAGSDLRFECGC